LPKVSVEVVPVALLTIVPALPVKLPTLWDVPFRSRVPPCSLGSDYFVYDEARHSVTGRHSGETHRLGDPVEVKLIEAAPLAGALRFELLSEGRIIPRARRPKADRWGHRAESRGGRRRRTAAR
jgi:ribonuclease R